MIVGAYEELLHRRQAHQTIASCLLCREIRVLQQPQNLRRRGRRQVQHSTIPAWRDSTQVALLIRGFLPPFLLSTNPSSFQLEGEIRVL